MCKIHRFVCVPWCPSVTVCARGSVSSSETKRRRTRWLVKEKWYYYLHANFKVVVFSWHHLPRSPTTICSQCASSLKISQNVRFQMCSPPPTHPDTLKINHAKEKSSLRTVEELASCRGLFNPPPSYQRPTPSSGFTDQSCRHCHQLGKGEMLP